MRIILGVCCVVLCAGRLLVAAEQGRAGQGRASLLQDTLQELVRESMPDRWEDSPGWGETKRVTTGVKVRTHDWKVKVDRRKEEVNHGLWKQYRVWMADPERQLRIRLVNVHWTDDRRLAFRARLAARLQGFARHARWENGVRLYSISAEGEATVELRLDCEVGVRVVPRGYFLAVALEPKVVDADVRLRDFDLHRVSKVGGWVAQELGDGLRETIARKLNQKEPKLVEKLNRSITKRRDKLTLSPGDLLESGWTGVTTLGKQGS